MDMLRAMRERHSVRQYLDRPIEDRALESLRVEIVACNREGGLNIQLIAGEPETFGGLPARLMHFARVRNYVALVGPEGSALEERLGWYGERLVLTAQALGLNTCWVAASYSRSKCKASVETGEKLVCGIAVGYGATQGKPHKSRAFDAVCRWEGEAPAWFRRGVEAALLAPTALNQQRFLFTLLPESRVLAQPTGGSYARLNLGIAKYHFHLAAGGENFRWAERT